MHSHIDVYVVALIPFAVQPLSHKDTLGKNNLNLSFKGRSLPSIGDLKWKHKSVKKSLKILKNLF